MFKIPTKREANIRASLWVAYVMTVMSHATRCKLRALPYIQILSGRLAWDPLGTSHPAGGVKTLHADTPIKSRRLLWSIGSGFTKRSKRLAQLSEGSSSLHTFTPSHFVRFSVSIDRFKFEFVDWTKFRSCLWIDWCKPQFRSEVQSSIVTGLPIPRPLQVWGYNPSRLSKLWKPGPNKSLYKSMG